MTLHHGVDAPAEASARPPHLAVVDVRRVLTVSCTTPAAAPAAPPSLQQERS